MSVSHLENALSTLSGVTLKLKRLRSSASPDDNYEIGRCIQELETAEADIQDAIDGQQ